MLLFILGPPRVFSAYSNGLGEGFAVALQRVVSVFIAQAGAIGVDGGPLLFKALSKPLGGLCACLVIIQGNYKRLPRGPLYAL